MFTKCSHICICSRYIKILKTTFYLLSSVTPSFLQILAKAASESAHFRASTYFKKGSSTSCLKELQGIISKDTGLLTRKFAVVTLYSYFPALLDQTMSIACELVRIVNARVTIDLIQ